MSVSDEASCAASAKTCKPTPAIIHTAPYPTTNRDIARARRCAKLRSRTCRSGAAISGGVMAASISSQPHASCIGELNTNARLNESGSGVRRPAEQRAGIVRSLQESGKSQAARLVTTSHPLNLRVALHIRRPHSIALPEHADAADADLGLISHRVTRHQQHVDLPRLDGAGKMQPVDDAGDIKDVGQPIAG